MRIILFVFMLVGLSCSKRNGDLLKEESLEQRALTVFFDSVAYQPVLYDADTSDNKVPILPGLPVDSVWEFKGMFFGYKLTASNYATEFSEPYVDTLSLIGRPELYDDSAKQEIKEYWQFFKSRSKTDSNKIELKIPDSLRIDRLGSYLARKSKRELFLQVYKKISSITTEMVEIRIFKYREEYQFHSSFRFHLWFHKKSGRYFYYFS